MKAHFFTLEFPKCKTNEELKRLHQDNPDIDPYYITSCAAHERRILFEKCYEVFSPYSDSNFLTEVTTRFHQRTWEMYLGYLLLQNKATLNAKRGDDAADIQVQEDGRLINIECTAITHGEENKPDSVPRIQISPSAYNLTLHEVPESKILLRISQGLKDKFLQYKSRLSKGNIAENDPYIFAINTGELLYPDNIPRILKALFGIGYQAIRMTIDGKRVQDQPSYWTRRENIPKSNHSEVDMCFFQHPDHAGISAVIYSNTNVLEYLVRGSHDDLILVHNPYAKNPIPWNMFPFITQFYVNETTGNLEMIVGGRPKPCEF